MRLSEKEKELIYEALETLLEDYSYPTFSTFGELEDHREHPEKKAILRIQEKINGELCNNKEY